MGGGGRDVREARVRRGPRLRRPGRRPAGRGAGAGGAGSGGGAARRAREEEAERDLEGAGHGAGHEPRQRPGEGGAEEGAGGEDGHEGGEKDGGALGRGPVGVGDGEGQGDVVGQQPPAEAGPAGGRGAGVRPPPPKGPALERGVERPAQRQRQPHARPRERGAGVRPRAGGGRRGRGRLAVRHEGGQMGAAQRRMPEGHRHGTGGGAGVCQRHVRTPPPPPPFRRTSEDPLRNAVNNARSGANGLMAGAGQCQRSLSQAHASPCQFGLWSRFHGATTDCRTFPRSNAQCSLAWICRTISSQCHRMLASCHSYQGSIRFQRSVGNCIIQFDYHNGCSR